MMTKEDLVDVLIQVVDCVSDCPKCDHCKEMAVQALDLAKHVTGKDLRKDRRQKTG